MRKEKTDSYPLTLHWVYILWDVLNNTYRACYTPNIVADIEPFTQGKHELKLTYSSSAELMEVVKNTKVRNLGPAQNFLVTQVTDLATAAINSTITPGANMRIEG